MLLLKTAEQQLAGASVETAEQQLALADETAEQQLVFVLKLKLLISSWCFC